MGWGSHPRENSFTTGNKIQSHSYKIFIANSLLLIWQFIRMNVLVKTVTHCKVLLKILSLIKKKRSFKRLTFCTYWTKLNKSNFICQYQWLCYFLICLSQPRFFFLKEPKLKSITSAITNFGDLSPGTNVHAYAYFHHVCRQMPLHLFEYLHKY